jgi:hypothetical protein
MTQPALTIPLELLPAPVRSMLVAQDDPRKKMMLAKASVPLPPDQLIPSLAFLVHDASEDIRQTAIRSLEELPEAMVLAVLDNQGTHAAILDTLARVYSAQPRAAARIISNRSTPDETLLYLAETDNPNVLELIANNQQRILRCPALVRPLYFNRSTPMAVASAVMELAVRNDLPVRDIPGYEEIASSILGTPRHSRSQPEEPDLLSSAAAQEALARALVPDEVLEQAELGVVEVSSFEDLEAAQQHEEAQQPVDHAQPSTNNQDAHKKSMLHDLLRDMKIPEKVRLALMGNGPARKLLAMDANRTVASAVMRNPGLTDREIAGFARNRGVNEEIIQRIVGDRELTKNYSIRLALVSNPRCPQYKAVAFLKTLRDNDLKAISRSRDVPGHVARTAKQILEEKLKLGKKK